MYGAKSKDQLEGLTERNNSGGVWFISASDFSAAEARIEPKLASLADGLAARACTHQAWRLVGEFGTDRSSDHLLLQSSALACQCDNSQSSRAGGRRDGAGGDG